ncbi:MAG: nuclear transport factor 2 family protein [Thiobacillus sp.]|nr:nuclear transport factor 2 family protein [Thiobacillus sp.]
MTPLTPNAALDFAHRWLDAWNRHDVDAVLDLFVAEPEFRSPYIVTFASEPSGCLRGRAALRRYWTTGLARIPDLNFSLIDVLAGVDSLTIYYLGHRGPVAETFRLDGHGRAISATACYSLTDTAAPPAPASNSSQA